ncbi:hypothetical protein FS749_007640 [Ceratobasidium sp. UAMH 11750]|nr:hypothetical protein FS749_007640 [Ceratobasidium sp. UAMH 11750]
MYIDGGLGYNNPSKELHNEARSIYGPEHPVGCFISIGTGCGKDVGFEHLLDAYSAFKAIVLGSERTHLEMERYFSGQPNIYFRFNAGMQLTDAKRDKDFFEAIALENWQKM